MEEARVKGSGVRDVAMNPEQAWEAAASWWQEIRLIITGPDQDVVLYPGYH